MKKINRNKINGWAYNSKWFRYYCVECQEEFNTLEELKKHQEETGHK